MAVVDLAQDLRSVLNAGLQRVENPREADILLIDLRRVEWPRLEIKGGEWERYQIDIADDRVLIAGSDSRGLCFGIYRFSETALGVSPIHWWIPSAPEARPAADMDSAIEVGPRTRFKYRGWFLGAEDLLANWNFGGFREAEHWYGGRRKAISYKVYGKIFETMLRLRVNLIIPGVLSDIRDPGVSRVYDMIRARGLLFTQHHIEPVGVCPGHEFINYCRGKGIDARFSWLNNRGIVEDCWRDYIDRIADYADNVIWQLGYRGTRDNPFWETEAGAPDDWPGRANVISSAIKRQYELIRERLGERAEIPATTTLWAEGNYLHQKGGLKLPAGVTPVVADTGRTQMLPDPMPEVKAAPHLGIYYHVSFYSTGPQLISGNSAENLLGNYRRALAAGADHYVMLLVSNLRPFLLETQIAARFAYGGDGEGTASIRQFCQDNFRQPEIEQLFHAYYKAFVHRKEAFLVEQNARWLDGALVMLIKRLLSVLESGNGFTTEGLRRFMEAGYRLQLLKEAPPIPDLIDTDNRENWLCRDWRSLCDYISPLLSESCERWEKLRKRIGEAGTQIPDSRPLFDYLLTWPSNVAAVLTNSALNLFKIADAYLKEQADKQADLLLEIERDLSELLEGAPTLTGQEHFRGWIDGDQYVNLRGILTRVRKVMAGDGSGRA